MWQYFERTKQQDIQQPAPVEHDEREDNGKVADAHAVGEHNLQQGGETEVTASDNLQSDFEPVQNEINQPPVQNWEQVEHWDGAKVVEAHPVREQYLQPIIETIELLCNNDISDQEPIWQHNIQTVLHVEDDVQVAEAHPIAGRDLQPVSNSEVQEFDSSWLHLTWLDNPHQDFFQCATDTRDTVVYSTLHTPENDAEQDILKLAIIAVGIAPTPANVLEPAPEKLLMQDYCMEELIQAAKDTEERENVNDGTGSPSLAEFIRRAEELEMLPSPFAQTPRRNTPFWGKGEQAYINGHVTFPDIRFKISKTRVYTRKERVMQQKLNDSLSDRRVREAKKRLLDQMCKQDKFGLLPIKATMSCRKPRSYYYPSMTPVVVNSDMPVVRGPAGVEFDRWFPRKH